MTLFRTLFAGFLVAVLTSAPAVAGPHGGPRGDTERGFRQPQQGRGLPLPQLESRVRPYMGGADYLGPEFNGGTYRLKFMQQGRVIWVDVDSQTGRIIRRSR